MDTLIEQLRGLRDHSELAWDMAVDSAGEIDTGTVTSDPDYVHEEEQARAERRAAARQADCADSRRRALDAWDLAIQALRDGRVTEGNETRQALESARTLAKQWGDDQHEREALQLLELGLTIRVDRQDDGPPTPRAAAHGNRSR